MLAVHRGQEEGIPKENMPTKLEENPNVDVIRSGLPTIISQVADILQNPAVKACFFSDIASQEIGAATIIYPSKIVEIVRAGVLNCLDTLQIILTDCNTLTKKGHGSHFQEAISAYSEKALKRICRSSTDLQREDLYKVIRILKSLSPFMDDTTDIIEHMCNSLSSSSACLGNEDSQNRLSAISFFILLMNENLEKEEKNKTKLSCRVMQTVLKLMETSENPDLCCVCQKLALTHPHYALTCTKEQFLLLLERPTEARLSLAASLLQQSPATVTYCEDWVLAQKLAKKQQAQYLEPLSTYVEIMRRSTGEPSFK